MPTSLSRFEAVTTANAVAQAMSAVYANILEIAATDVFANVGGFTLFLPLAASRPSHFQTAGCSK